EVLLAAIDGFEFQKLRLDAQIAEIKQQLSGGDDASESPAPKSGRKKFSAAARKRMAASQKARWAKIKGGAAPAAKAAAPAPMKPRRSATPLSAWTPMPLFES